MKIIDQQLKWNEKTNETALVTQYVDGSIKWENLTSEEAAQWQAENKY